MDKRELQALQRQLEVERDERKRAAQLVAEREGEIRALKSASLTTQRMVDQAEARTQMHQGHGKADVQVEHTRYSG